jgi:hypothetical protein
VLVGNGLSIAFNPDLTLKAITDEMVTRIEHASTFGNSVVRAMKKMAQRALQEGDSGEDDFEKLVGVFGTESRNMDILQQLAQLTFPNDRELRDAIQKAARFTTQVRDNGLSYVLEVIAERSHAYQERTEDLCAFVRAVTTGFGGRVYFGNLNYDTLLLSAIMSVCAGREFEDMAHGSRVVGGGPARHPEES